MPNSKDKPGHLNPKQVELVYGITRKTLANWRAKCIGPPFYKIGYNLVLYKVSEIEEWINSKRVRTEDYLD